MGENKETTKSHQGSRKTPEGKKVLREKGCGGVQIFDSANDTYAKTSQEASRQSGEADWMKLTAGTMKRGEGALREASEQSGICSDASAAESAVKTKKRKRTTRSAKTGVSGKKDKYHRIVRDKLTLILHWKRMGWTDEEVAKRLGIAYSTFKVYKGKYEELSAVLRAGADEANAEVENALFGRAVGMKATVKKPMKVKTVEYENGKRVREEEKIEYGEEEVFVPPDVTADVFYLKNRMPDRWGDKRNPDGEERKTGIVLIPEV